MVGVGFADGRARRVSRHLVIAALAALLAMLAMPVAARAEGSMGGKPQVRLVDLSSDTQTADFYIDGAKAWSNAVYKTVSNYIEVSPGAHVFEVRPAGAAADSAPAAKVQGSAEAGSYYSVLTAGLLGSLKMTVLSDGSSTMPTPDVCQARFINAAPGLAALDFQIQGLDNGVKKLGFLESSAYGQLPRGVYDVEMRDSQNQTVIASIKNWFAPGGHMHTLVAAGGVGRPVELVEFYDAMSADQVPEGAAHTGMGGGSPGGAPAGAFLLLPVALLGAAVLVPRLRRLRP